MSTQVGGNATEQISLDEILSHTTDGVFVLDQSRRFIIFNPALQKLTGFTPDEVLASGCSCKDVTDCEDEQGRSIAGRLCPGYGVFNGEVNSARQRMRITTKSGDHRWVDATYAALAKDGDVPAYVLVVMRDISEQKEREEHWLKTISDLRNEVERLREQLRERYGFNSIISRSPNMQEVLELTRSACTNGSPVLICGESGSGKEMIAKTIACNGLQKDGPFVPANVAAMPEERMEAELFGYVQGAFNEANNDYEGLYRAADGGTLFIQDVDRLPNSVQAKLLQSMQDKAVRPIGSTHHVPVNVRVIATTSRSVDDLITSGSIREDLYYRLSVITIDVPPLRARKEDIPLLAEHFIGQLNQQSSRTITDIAPGVWATLEAYDWPGNVRELQHVIESAFTASHSNILEPDSLRLAGGQRRSRTLDAHPESISLDEILADTERRAILTSLRRAHGQRSRAAQMMGISRSRLYRRMEALGIASKRDRFTD
jgi:PAS domain S-box-containing protein